MIAQFQTPDDAYFVLDLDHFVWYQPAEPMRVDDQDNLIVPDGTPSGKLIPMRDSLTFSLAGRTSQTPGPGNGLCVFAMRLYPFGRTLIFLMEGNVPLKNRTALVPLESIRYFGREELFQAAQCGK